MIQKDDKFEYIDTFYLYKGMAQLKFKEGNPIDSF